MRLSSSPSVLAASLSACFKARTCSCLFSPQDLASQFCKAPQGREVSSAILCFPAEKTTLVRRTVHNPPFRSSFFPNIPLKICLAHGTRVQTLKCICLFVLTNRDRQTNRHTVTCQPPTINLATTVDHLADLTADLRVASLAGAVMTHRFHVPPRSRTCPSRLCSGALTSLFAPADRLNSICPSASTGRLKVETRVQLFLVYY